MSHTSDPTLRMILKWPVIFVGASPSEAPAMYSLLSYAAYALGTWYPVDTPDGMAAPAIGLARLAEETGHVRGVRARSARIFHHFTLSCSNYVRRISLTSLTYTTRKNHSKKNQRSNTNSIMTKTELALRARTQVRIALNREIRKFLWKDSKATHVCFDNDLCEKVDGVVAAADYQYVEQHLLPRESCDDTLRAIGIEE